MLSKSKLVFIFLLSIYIQNISFAQSVAPTKIDVVNGDVILNGGKKIVNKKYVTHKKVVIIKDTIKVDNSLPQRIASKGTLDSLIFLNPQRLPYTIIYYVGDADNETYYLYEQIKDFLESHGRTVDFIQRDCRFCQPPEEKRQDIRFSIEDGKFIIMINRQQ